MPAARRDAVLLDTNMLLLLGIGLLNPDDVSRYKRTNQYERSDYERLRTLMAPFRRTITTPHILAELSNLAIDVGTGKPSRHVKTLVDLIRQTWEVSVAKDAYVDHPAFIRLGVTDAAILTLAVQDRRPVITDDFLLYSYLLRAKATVAKLSHGRGKEWGL